MIRIISRFARRTPFTTFRRKIIFTNNAKAPDNDIAFKMLNITGLYFWLNATYDKYQESKRIYDLDNLYKIQNDKCYSTLVDEIKKIEEYSPELANKLKNSLFDHLKKFNISSIGNSKLDLSSDKKFLYSKIIPTIGFSIESSNPENYGFKNDKDNKIFLSLSKIIYLNREIMANCRKFLENSPDEKYEKCFFDMENFNQIALNEYFNMNYNFPKK